MSADQNFRCLPPLLCVVSALLILVGCAERVPPAYLHTVVRDAEGLLPGSPVMWRGVEVGTVEAMEIEGDGVRVSINLLPEYQAVIREGARAKVMRGALTRDRPSLQIYGGTSQDRPVLQAGSTIPEATFVDTYRDHFLFKHKEWVLVAAILLFVIFFVLSGIKRLIVLGLAVLAVVFSFHVLRMQWERYRDDMLTPEIEARIDDWANQTIRSPQAVEYWTQLRGDMGEILDQAKERGSEASDWARDRISDALQSKADEARARGEEMAADELIRLREGLQSMLGRLEDIKGTAQDVEDDVKEKP